MSEEGEIVGKIRRHSQVGIYHVYLRGNSKHIIFYDDQDRIQFCKRIEKYSLIQGVKIYAFALMDNHIHLLIKVNSEKTSLLSDFISSVLKSFVCYYNRKYRLSDRLCKSPFNSAPKDSIERIKSSLVYILQNPVKAQICKNPFDYEWSSAKVYFDKKGKNRYVTIDIDFVEALFNSREEFLTMLIDSNIADSEIREKEDSWIRISDNELSVELHKLLKGRLLSSLTKRELTELSKKLIDSTNASYGQIASLLHVCYEFVRVSKSFEG